MPGGPGNGHGKGDSKGGWNAQWKDWKGSANDDWSDSEDNYESMTGPQAEDPAFECPDAPNEEEKKRLEDKIPKPINLSGNDNEKGELPNFWGGRASVGQLLPCDKCNQVFPCAMAMIQCYHSNGEVPNTSGAGKRSATRKKRSPISRKNSHG